MKTIRYGIFETNSSSTHAIGLIRYNNFIVPKEIKYIYGLHFDWAHEIYDSENEKFTYLVTAMNELKYDDFYAGITIISDALKEAGVERIIYPEVKLNHNGKKNSDGKISSKDIKVIVEETNNEKDYTYIDHGEDFNYQFYHGENLNISDAPDKDSYNFLRSILSTKERIKRFILGNSWITTSNDNDGEGYALPNRNLTEIVAYGYYDDEDPEDLDFIEQYKKLNDEYQIYFK